MSMVVGPAGFTGEEDLPAPTRGYLSRYAGPAQNTGARSVESPTPDPAPEPDLPTERAHDDSAMMDRFLADYLRLMTGRVELIQHYVDQIRYEEARVAILSLESASGMVGEAPLRRMLHDLRLCVDVCSAADRTARMAAIRAETAVVHDRLSASA